MSGNIECVQPGERGLFRLERSIGRLRRAWLRRFRPGYVSLMAAQRQGQCPNCTHDVIDSRDLKLVRNVCGYDFPPAADRYRWRACLPFARQGLIEVVVVGGGGLIMAIALSIFAPWYALGPATLSIFYLWFFRDPRRQFPLATDLVVSPCDGILDDVWPVAHCDLLGRPALRFGISLSLFDVHLNRAPIAGTVMTLHYRPGEFRNAMRKGDHSNNEQFWTVIDPQAPESAPIAVRQIAGPMARTIVNECRLDELLARSSIMGMIKFGSRTELYIPADAKYEILAKLGQRMVGGVTPMLRVRPRAASAQE